MEEIKLTSYLRHENAWTLISETPAVVNIKTIPPKRLYISTRLQGLTSQIAAMLIFELCIKIHRNFLLRGLSICADMEAKLNASQISAQSGNIIRLSFCLR
jgi:hypothetical protein